MSTTLVVDGVGVSVGIVWFGCKFSFKRIVPLFHTRVLPDLIQVNFLPCENFIWPLVVHLEPALIAAKAGIESEAPVKVRAIKTAKDLFLTQKIVLSPRR